MPILLTIMAPMAKIEIQANVPIIILSCLASLLFSRLFPICVAHVSSWGANSKTVCHGQKYLGHIILDFCDLKENVQVLSDSYCFMTQAVSRTECLSTLG